MKIGCEPIGVIHSPFQTMEGMPNKISGQPGMGVKKGKSTTCFPMSRGTDFSSFLV